MAEFIQNDWRKADLTVAERAMLEWSEKLTLTPAMMTEADIQGLRDVGWTDRDILDIAHVCAYFNFRVRMVDGLGLEVPDTSAERATAARQHAAELAKEKGVTLPSDIWGVGEQAKAAKARA
ncbi:uncharacterized protein METZ01_LOCUS385097 [marine metagenome]|uniref:Peroxidase n=1 Tax=marine metagenome TaxID=408172 RepID=A0A382UDC0_9ZZZZ